MSLQQNNQNHNQYGNHIQDFQNHYLTALIPSILSMISSSLTILTYIFKKKQRNKAFLMICIMQSFDFLLALNYLVSNLEIFGGKTKENQNYLKGMFLVQNFLACSSMTWTMIIAFTVYISVQHDWNTVKAYKKHIISMGVVLPALQTIGMVVSLLFSQSELNFKQNQVIVPNEMNLIQSLVSFPTFVMIMFIPSIVLVGKTLKFIKSEYLEEFANHYNKIITYPLIPFISIILVTIKVYANQIYSQQQQSEFSNDQVYLSVMVIMVCSWGFLNSIVYGYFTQVFKIQFCYDISDCASPQKRSSFIKQNRSFSSSQPSIQYKFRSPGYIQRKCQKSKSQNHPSIEDLDSKIQEQNSMGDSDNDHDTLRDNLLVSEFLDI